MTYDALLRKLLKLSSESKWTELRDRAVEGAKAFPTADVAAYAAHASANEAEPAEMTCT